MPEPEPSSLITVYDEQGRELHVERSAWERDVIVPNLQKAWNDPEALCAQVIQGMDDFPQTIARAAVRLVEIDGASERSLVVHSILLMGIGDLAGAERALDTCSQKHGRTGVVLTNLAKVYADRNEEERSHATLREALQVEPNFDNALRWWAAIARERGGDEAYLAALEEIAKIPGSWLAELYIAKFKLRRGGQAAALETYERVLSTAAHEDDVMLMISGDLGGAGALEDLVRLIGPHYDPAQDSPRVGLNLIQSLIMLGQLDAAQSLLERVQALKLAPYASHLAEMEQEIASRRAG